MITIFEFDIVVAFWLVGAWLEGINGKRGFFDEFIAPLPYGLAGLGLVLIERLGAPS